MMNTVTCDPITSVLVAPTRMLHSGSFNRCGKTVCSFQIKSNQRYVARHSGFSMKTTTCSVFPGPKQTNKTKRKKKVLQAVFWFTFMSGEGLAVCLEIFSTVYNSCVAFWNASPPPRAVYIRPFQCIIAPARSSDRTTWLMLNSSRSKMCLLINTGPRAPFVYCSHGGSRLFRKYRRRLPCVGENLTMWRLVESKLGGEQRKNRRGGWCVFSGGGFRGCCLFICLSFSLFEIEHLSVWIMVSCS